MKNMNILKVTWNCGLFSCFSQRLGAIISYANNNKQFPDIIDSSTQFETYKTNINEDITNYLLSNN